MHGCLLECNAVVVLEEKNHNYMFICRQLQGLSTGRSILTIPNHTIKLQLHRPRHLIILRRKKKKKKYLSIQLLIRGTCRVATDGKSERPNFP